MRPVPPLTRRNLHDRAAPKHCASKGSSWAGLILAAPRRRRISQLFWTWATSSAKMGREGRRQRGIIARSSTIASPVSSRTTTDSEVWPSVGIITPLMLKNKRGIPPPPTPPQRPRPESERTASIVSSEVSSTFPRVLHPAAGVSELLQAMVYLLTTWRRAPLDVLDIRHRTDMVPMTAGDNDNFDILGNLGQNRRRAYGNYQPDPGRRHILVRILRRPLKDNSGRTPAGIWRSSFHPSSHLYRHRDQCLTIISACVSQDNRFGR